MVKRNIPDATISMTESVRPLFLILRVRVFSYVEKRRREMKSYQEVIKELQTNETEGLTKTQVEEKTSQFGPNALQEKKKTPLIIKFLSEFKDFMVIILLILLRVIWLVVIRQ